MAHRESLTVLVVTHRHENYIAEAIESVERQEDVEINRIIISDDCSPDDTVMVARETIERLGMNAEVLESVQNMGITRHYQQLFNNLDTDLVAVLEGDDYWFSNLKLSRQVSLMREYPRASSCSQTFLLYDQDSNSMRTGDFGSGALSILGTETLIRERAGYCFSNMMYRVDSLRRIPQEIYSIPTAYDWIVNILVSRHGPLIYQDLPGIVHRVSQNGSWEGLTLAAQRESMIEGIESYMPYLDEYSAQIFAIALGEAKRDHNEAAMPRPIRFGLRLLRKSGERIKRLAGSQVR